MHEVLKRHNPKQLKAVTTPNRTSKSVGMEDMAKKSYAHPFQPQQSIRNHYPSEIADKPCFFDSVSRDNNSIDTGHTPTIRSSSNIIQKVPIEVTEGQTEETSVEDSVVFPGLDSCLGITVKSGAKIHAVHLTIPFGVESAIMYCKQVDDICKFNTDHILHISYNSEATMGDEKISANSHNEVIEHTNNLNLLKSYFNGENELNQKEITELEKNDSEIEEIIHEVEERIKLLEQKIECRVDCIKKIDKCINQLATLKEEEVSYVYERNEDKSKSIQIENWFETCIYGEDKRSFNIVSYQPPQ